MLDAMEVRRKAIYLFIYELLKLGDEQKNLKTHLCSLAFLLLLFWALLET